MDRYFVFADLNHGFDCLYVEFYS